MTRLGSSDSPIRVDFLPAAALGLRGRLGLSLAPGKQDVRWARDLALDLGRLRDTYRIGALVTLLEATEHELLKIPELVERARSEVGEVIELPIRDVSVPSSMPALVDAVAAALERAARGTNVLVHCRGGLGRSGLFAACCLVARGMAPEPAIALVRAVRPNAVETREQEQCVTAFAAAWAGSGHGPALDAAARATLGDAPSVDPRRVRGSLLGGALGDALGYPVEFIASAATIQQRFGATAPAALAFATPSPAQISDDTQMTLFTAEGLVRAAQLGHSDPGASRLAPVHRALHRWLATQDDRVSEVLAAASPGWLVAVPGLASRRAPGNTCLGSLRSQAELWHVPSIDAPTNDSKGCGAIMRAAPIGLVAPSREQAFELARDTAVLTHGHPSGYLSAAYFAALIFDLARDAPLDRAMRAADALLASERESEETVQAIAQARSIAARGAPCAADFEALGGGWTGESALAIALVVALTADAGSRQGFAEALWLAVAHGGDSDSTGSIAGNLLGAAHGDAVLPERWLSELELGDVVDRIASDLYDACVLGAALDVESYPPG